MKRTLLSLTALSAFAQFTEVSARSLEAREYLVCGWPGYDIGHHSFFTTADGTYPTCSAACFANSQCKSFAYAPGSCLLYDVIAIYNHATNFSSPYRFYDTECEKGTPICDYPAYEERLEPIDYEATITNADCINKCLNQPNCRSYAYGNSECLIYDVPANGNANGMASSPYKFNDRACIKPPGTSGTTSTTKTTTKSSTTTKGSTTSSTKPSTATTTTTVKQNTSTTTKPSATTVTTTTTKIATTTVTISNQQFYCTAIKK